MLYWNMRRRKEMQRTAYNSMVVPAWMDLRISRQPTDSKTILARKVGALCDRV